MAKKEEEFDDFDELEELAEEEEKNEKDEFDLDLEEETPKKKPMIERPTQRQPQQLPVRQPVKQLPARKSVREMAEEMSLKEMEEAQEDIPVEPVPEPVRRERVQTKPQAAPATRAGVEPKAEVVDKYLPLVMQKRYMVIDSATNQSLVETEDLEQANFFLLTTILNRLERIENNLY